MTRSRTVQCYSVQSITVQYGLEWSGVIHYSLVQASKVQSSPVQSWMVLNGPVQSNTVPLSHSNGSLKASRGSSGFCKWHDCIITLTREDVMALSPWPPPLDRRTTWRCFIHMPPVFSKVWTLLQCCPLDRMQRCKAEEPSSYSCPSASLT